jgi:hypothetical protein
MHGGDGIRQWFWHSEPVDLEFSGEVWYWRGPSPYHYVTVPDQESAAIESTASLVSYGWGVIPVTARLGRTTWTTSLFPKDGRYLVPLKTVVRKAERVDLGDTVTIGLTIDV